jgi:hypothetical protein
VVVQEAALVAAVLVVVLAGPRLNSQASLK